MVGNDHVTVAEAVADELALAGVDRVFGLPGGEVLFLIDALRRRGIEFVLCRHEANAGIMAAVYGKLRDTVGVVLTTLGPGAANLMLPLASSYLEREPLLAISAETPSSWPSSHTHQRLPLHEVYRPVTKQTEAVRSLNARSAVRRAISASLREPLGPTYLTLSAADSQTISVEPAERSVAAELDAPVSVAVDAVADELRELIGKAERPLIVFGIGIRHDQAKEVRNWIGQWGLPVAVTPKIKGIVDETDDTFVGVVGGMAIDRVMTAALEHADLIVGFGLDPVEIDKQWHATLPINWVLESPMAGGSMPQDRLQLADHRALLERLGSMEAPRKWDDPFGEFRRRRQGVFYDESSDDGDLLPVEIVRALAEVLPPETIVTTDVGSHKYLFGQFWPSRLPETFFMSNGLSGMGYGLPAALAAKLARPEVPVLAVLGDGGFSMNSQELETARRIGAPAIVVVLADQSYSLIRMAQESRELTNYGVDFTPIDSVLAAQSCGVNGVHATTKREISEAAKAALESGECVVIEVPLDASRYRNIV